MRFPVLNFICLTRKAHFIIGDGLKGICYIKTFSED